MLGRVLLCLSVRGVLQSFGTFPGPGLIVLVHIPMGAGINTLVNSRMESFTDKAFTDYQMEKYFMKESL